MSVNLKKQNQSQISRVSKYGAILWSATHNDKINYLVCKLYIKQSQMNCLNKVLLSQNPNSNLNDDTMLSTTPDGKQSYTVL